MCNSPSVNAAATIVQTTHEPIHRLWRVRATVSRKAEHCRKALRTQRARVGSWRPGTSDAQDGKSVVPFLLASDAALQLRRFMGANRDVDVTIGRYG